MILPANSVFRRRTWIAGSTAGLTAEFDASTPVKTLAVGEPAWDYDEEKGKVGDGVTSFAALPYVLGATGGGGGGTPDDGSVTPAKFAPSAIDPAVGVAGARTLGPGAQQAAPGNDARLADARTPTAHAASHATGSTDPITPASIGAAIPAQGFVGMPPWSLVSAAVVQAADRVYFYEVPGPMRDVAVTTARVDWSAIAVGNFAAALYRKDTGALIASTGVLAVPGAVGTLSHACSTTGTFPAGVAAVIAWGCSVGATVSVRSPFTSTATNGEYWGSGAGRLFYGAIGTYAGLALPANPPAATGIQRIPGVIFT